jgi:sugar phosphate isomerase/epimerase
MLSNATVGYSTNVHPGDSLEELWASLEDAEVVRHLVDPKRPLPIELRLSLPVTQAMARDRGLVAGLATSLRDRGLRAVSVSAFSPLPFHGQPVKENAYLPRWDQEERVVFSQQVADVLAGFGPPDEPFLSFSTLAGVLKHHVTSRDTDAAIARNMARVALHCHRVAQRTGRKIVMALEPEPGLTYETTDEVIAFFRGPLDRAFTETLAPETVGPTTAVALGRELVGVNFDFCHQSIEYEDNPASLRRLVDAGIRLYKCHAANAMRVVDPLNSDKAMDALEPFTESIFPHQVVGADWNGRRVFFCMDLPYLYTEAGRKEMAATGVREIRIHYHVPVFGNFSPDIDTTIEGTWAGISAFRTLAPQAPIIVECYTWTEQGGEQDDRRRWIQEGLAREVRTVHETILLG